MRRCRVPSPHPTVISMDHQKLNLKLELGNVGIGTRMLRFQGNPHQIGDNLSAGINREIELHIYCILIIWFCKFQLKLYKGRVVDFEIWYGNLPI